MKSTFGEFGYDRDAVPTIWLKDSTADSPHGIITAAQNGRSPTGIPSYEQIRSWGVEDMQKAGVPSGSIDEYLAANDGYFRHNVLPKMLEELDIETVERLVGTDLLKSWGVIE
jgi:hypothetical protein